MTHTIYILTDAKGEFIAASDSREKLEDRAHSINEIHAAFTTLRGKPLYALPLIITIGEARWDKKELCTKKNL